MLKVKKMLTLTVISWRHKFLCYKEMSKNPKNWWKSMKIANIDRQTLHNFWKTGGISMKFSGKMCLMTILKVTKNQGFTLYLEDTFFGKPQGEEKLTPPSRFRVNNYNVDILTPLQIISHKLKNINNLIILTLLKGTYKLRNYKKFSILLN